MSKQNSFGVECQSHQPTTSAAKTPERPQSLITPVRRCPSGQRLSQMVASDSASSGFNAGQQMLLQLQILKRSAGLDRAVQSPEDLVNLYTNSSETSSGYLSNSTQNLSQYSSARPVAPHDSRYSSPTSCSVTPPIPACLQEEMANCSQADLV